MNFGYSRQQLNLPCSVGELKGADALACTFNKIPSLLGRAIFGGFFIYSGINHFKQRESVTRLAKTKHVPKPDAAVIATGIALIAGGTSIALGIKPKLGAAPIIGFLATASPIIHNFWNERDPKERMHNMVDFSKNIALLGSALALTGERKPEMA